MKSLSWAGFLISDPHACVLAAPLLVEAGIDDGIPPLLPGGSGDKTVIIVVGRRLPAHHRGERGRRSTSSSS